MYIAYTDAIVRQPIGLETLVEHNSTDPNDFRLLSINYMGQAFGSVDAFIEAYNSNTINKINVRLDAEWSSFSRYDHTFPSVWRL
jgi:hypothetical protein